MTDLSDAAEILKRASMQKQVQETNKSQVITSSSTPAKPAFYSMTAPSGKVVKMTGEDKDINPGKTVISE